MRYYGDKIMKILLRCRLFFLCFMSGCAECFFATLGAARFARRCSRNIEDDFAVVAAAICTCAVWNAKCAAFTADGTQGAQRMMAAAFSCLRAVYPHSDYHGEDYTLKG